MPKVSTLIHQMLETEIVKNGKSVKLKNIVDKEIRKEQRVKESDENFEFAHFFCNLLRRGGREMKSKGEEQFKKRFRLDLVPNIAPHDVDFTKKKPNSRKSNSILEELKDLSKTDFGTLIDLLTEAHYGLGVGPATWVLIGAKQVVFNQHGSFQNYLDEASKHKKDGFQKDNLLKVHFIGPKVRDLALSTFNEQYLAVDVNVKGVLFRTGLVCYTYKLKVRINGYQLPGDYWQIRKLCCDLAKEAKMTPMIFDRILWRFANEFCNQKNCERCPVILCLTHP